MKNELTTRQNKQWRFSGRQVWLVGAAMFFLAVLMIGGPVIAQTFIEPTSSGIGGNTATPLNSSPTTQRKTGSLLIGPNGTCTAGDKTGCRKLCLNAADETSTTDCISSWDSLRTGSYVTLRQETVGASYATADSGYARIKSDGTKNQLYTLIAETTSTASNAAAVYATDGGNAANFAGSFNGKVLIDDVPAHSAKVLCLNATDPDISDGKGCIASWNAFASLIQPGPFVNLQPIPSPANAQPGGESLAGAGVFGTGSKTSGGVVLGVPPSGSSICSTCGDGVCSSGETAVNCPFNAAVPGCPNVPGPPLWSGGDCS